MQQPDTSDDLFIRRPVRPEAMLLSAAIFTGPGAIPNVWALERIICPFPRPQDQDAGQNCSNSQQSRGLRPAPRQRAGSRPSGQPPNRKDIGRGIGRFDPRAPCPRAVCFTTQVRQIRGRTSPFGCVVVDHDPTGAHRPGLPRLKTGLVFDWRETRVAPPRSMGEWNSLAITRHVAFMMGDTD
jgi:hypothetical protein